MDVTLQEIISDLINQPGLGMFAWMCTVFFVVAFVFFVWAFKSGQFSGLEDSKFDMFDDEKRKGASKNG